LGYQVRKLPIEIPQPGANDAGRHLAHQLLKARSERRDACVISGGETTVKLAEPPLRGRGGRNQQVALSALVELRRLNGQGNISQSAGRWVILSAGTDGEDGPTDAAGAIVDGELLNDVYPGSYAPETCLARNDAYSYFDHVGRLLKTGATGTNVGDLRVILWRPQ
jgi:glycerate-2-kinase